MLQPGRRATRSHHLYVDFFIFSLSATRLLPFCCFLKKTGIFFFFLEAGSFRKCVFVLLGGT